MRIGRRYSVFLFAIIFIIFPMAAFAGGGTLSNGSTLSGNITNSGTTPIPFDSWTFSGAAGDFAYIGFTVTNSPKNASLCMNLIRPDGSQSGCYYGSFIVDGYSLSQTGTYTVNVVWGSGTASTVGYSVVLGETGSSFAGGPVSNGATVSSSLANAASLDEYTAYIPAGVSFFAAVSAIVSAPSTLGISMYMAAPGGAYLYRGTDFNNVNSYTSVGGNYRFIVKRDDGALTSAAYNFTVAIGGIPASLAGGMAMASGNTYSGTLEHGVLDQWPFTASAGQRVTVSIADAPGDPAGASTAFDIFNPIGQKLFSGLSPNWTFTATAGSYRVVVYRADDGTAGYYQDALYTLTLTNGGTNPDQSASAMNGDGQPCSCSGQGVTDQSMQARQGIEQVHGPDRSAAFVAEPINLATGNLAEQVTDYTTAGQNPLTFTRYYNSQANTNSSPIASSLGVNWRHNYDRALILQSSTNVLAERPDGSVLTFASSGGVWRTSSDRDMSLTHAGATWILTDGNDTAETYATNGSIAQLQQIKLRNGYAQNLGYSGALLIAVTDSYSRSLSFAYAGNLLKTITTHDALVLTYTLSDTGSGSRLTGVSYNTSPSTSLTYLYENTDFPFALTGVIDERANRYQTWTYDRQGRATSSLNGDGKSFSANLYTVAYDDSTGNRTVTGPLGQPVLYKFRYLNGVYKVSEVDRQANGEVAAASRTYAYDDSGYMNSRTDWNGTATTFINNAQGNPTTINEGVVSGTPTRTTTVTYDSAWPRLPHTIVTPGLTSTLDYDSGTGNLLTRDDADTTSQTAPYSTKGQTRTTTYSWTPTGQLHTVRLPRTDVTATTTYSYAGGTLSGISDALGHATRITAYTAGGLPTTVVDPNGVTTTLTYDARRYLTSSAVTMAGGVRRTVYGRDAAENLTSLRLPDNSALTYIYDDAHRLIKMTDLFPHSANYTLDAMGNQTAVALEDSHNTPTKMNTRTYDALGRLTADIGGEGQETQYAYDANSNPVSIIDPMKNPATTQIFDALDRLQQVTDRAKGVTKISYDAHDRPLSVITPHGPKTTFVYNGFGDMIQQISPDSGKTVYRYDPDSNLTSKTDALGIVANYTYDALDRRTGISYPASPTENVTYSYDQAGHGQGIGRLTGMTDQAGTFSRSYDERGAITTESHTHGAVTLATGYTYNAAGRLATITYPDGMIVTQSRNASGDIVGLSLKPTGSGASQTIIASGHPLPFGPLNSFTFGNGIAVSRAYDLDYRLAKVTDTGRSKIQDLTYALNANDNVTTITDAVISGNSQSLTYDALDRLLTAHGGYGSESFGYDPNGNRTSLNGVANSYAPNTNRLTQIGTGTQTVTTNGNGNITGIAYSTPMGFAYNNANRLATVTSGGSAVLSYLYDGFGQRIGKTDTIQRFEAYDQFGRFIEQTDNTDTAKLDYIYLDGLPVATFVPDGAAGTLSFLHTDRLGTPRLATSSSQAVGWSATAADPFDAPNAAAGGNIIANDLRMPGQEFEAAAGFNHNGFRDYAPGLGRYLEVDPIGLVAGINTYAYTRSDPTRFADPRGLETAPISVGTPTTGGAFPFGTASGAFLPPDVDCPQTAQQCASDPRFGKYFGLPQVFHCSDTQGYQELNPSPGHRAQECFYRPDNQIETNWCKGSPDQFNGRTEPIGHGIFDDGGILSINGLKGFLGTLWNDFVPGAY